MCIRDRCKQRGYAAPVNILMEPGVLSKEKYVDWRLGRVDYLERVCTANLHKLSEIMRAIRNCTREHELKPSVAVYKQWGDKKEERTSV